ncbi:hypothetical protein [Streptomyces otsuchiensis]|uniref:hypothetical protein n=1 Tax=Streptomyces otsuchiensis TaxID=2681388 RepID=UPI001030AD40|nr:hypothetical protein [Streptomyces otsuchiensis]
MSRNAPLEDWELVGESGDPVPGDPEEVAAIGRELAEMAETINRQAGEIDALVSAENWDSDAAKAFREESDGTSEQLRKAYARYDAAADALGSRVSNNGTDPRADTDTDLHYTDYASELARAQRIADAALSDAVEANGEVTTASAAIDGLDDDIEDDDPELTGLESCLSAAQGTVTRCGQAVERAKSIRDRAATRAVNAINDVINDKAYKDSFWDKIKGAVGEISKWAGRIAAVAGVLSLFLGWVPFLGQALVAITLIATVVSLAANTALAVSGDGSWIDVALDVVGLATFGVGAAALRSGRAAAHGLKPVARQAAYKASQRAGANRQVARETSKKLVPDAVTGQARRRAIDGMPSRRLPFAPMPATANTRLHTLARLDPDIKSITNSLRRIDPSVYRESAVATATQNFNSHVAVWTASTTTGVAASSVAFSRTF